MSGLHWFPFYWTDYSGKTMHLSQGEHGAYLLLMRWIYTKKEPVPDKQRYSIAQARLKQEMANVDSVLGQFFHRDGELWRNIKAEEVIAQANEKHQKFSDAGRAGGLKRASNVQASLQPTSSNYNHTQNQKKEDITSLRSVIPTPKKSRKQIPDDFPDLKDQLWAQELWLKRGRSDICGLMGEEIEKFRDHHAGKLTASADWPASWRTWARNAIKFSNGGHNGRKESAHDKFIQGASAAFDHFQNGAAERGPDNGSSDEASVILLSSRLHGGSG